MGFGWPVDLVEEDGGVSVCFPDVPGAITWGSTREEALNQAEDALVSLIAALIAGGQSIPVASASRGRPVITVAPLDAAKMALHMAMIERGTSNVELGRRLGLTEKAVRRLVDPLHHSRIEKVDAALRALGKRLEVSVLELS